ncbi:DJ-1/PfpI family protein [Sneathiella aquimaris]|uniref:DJ-1/PfpI family protein n=1 Tax=Sneathiella aquimaris TaxID=2599305 RepID=UPI00146B7664|nr:DJ-1/PfpI family protein [Sneathiella aquimaris]
MHISLLTFDGFNELDSLIALGILNRVKKQDWRVSIASPTRTVRSMNGVVIERHISLEEACKAEVILVGSGSKTREIATDHALMGQIDLNPRHQLIGAQCSGTLLLAKLGLLSDIPACTDLTTRPWVEDEGIEVLEQAFHASGNIATAGGCLASQYLAFWVLARTEGLKAAEDALHYVAPVGEKEDYVARARDIAGPFLSATVAT